MRVRQQKVRDVIRRILPGGTVYGRRSWSLVPFWPPDLFAVAATLVNLSGCYANTRYLCGFDDCSYNERHWRKVARLGQAFSEGTVAPELQAEWDILLGGDWSITDDSDWWDAAMMLMSVADEACAGIGFVPEKAQGISFLVFDAYRSLLRHRPTPLPFLPNSLCIDVAPDVASVLPKTRTPQVGCTLRSLSHNLALLPPAGEVKTYWKYAISEDDNSEEPLNVLLVPFPYRVRGSCFVPLPTKETAASPRAAHFELQQKWLTDHNVDAVEMARFIQQLITEGRREVEKVDAVVLPETALTEEMAIKVASVLGREANIELFVTGVVARDGDRARNRTFSAIYKGGSAVASWTQSKHHRWKLDEQQVRRYNLGHVLGKKRSWWESIDVSTRECHFYVFRHGASLAVLICEDLARIEPVQNVVRAVGPNLVIALLMDGPQLERRWPGRYATVLADDPGSAVLTLTSLGLIRRSNMPSEKGARYIGLWKDSLGSARELELPERAHALLLTLSPRKETNVTADGRSDSGMTTTLSLTSVIGLRVPAPPDWIDADV